MIVVILVVIGFIQLINKICNRGKFFKILFLMILGMFEEWFYQVLIIKKFIILLSIEGVDYCLLKFS